MPGEKSESVHLALFPSFEQEYDNKELAEKWDTILKTRDRVLKCLEDARTSKMIGNSLEASVKLSAAEKLCEFLNACGGLLPDIYIVSEVSVQIKEGCTGSCLEDFVEGMEIEVSKAKGEKCERCWKYFVSQDASVKVCQRCQAALKEYNADS